MFSGVSTKFRTFVLFYTKLIPEVWEYAQILITLIEDRSLRAIEVICVKSTWQGSFSTLAALRVYFRKITKIDMVDCVYQSSGVCLFLFGQGMWPKFPTNPLTYIRPNKIKPTLPESLRFRWYNLITSNMASFTTFNKDSLNFNSDLGLFVVWYWLTMTFQC